MDVVFGLGVPLVLLALQCWALDRYGMKPSEPVARIVNIRYATFLACGYLCFNLLYMLMSSMVIDPTDRRDISCVLGDAAGRTSGHLLLTPWMIVLACLVGFSEGSSMATWHTYKTILGTTLALLFGVVFTAECTASPVGLGWFSGLFSILYVGCTLCIMPAYFMHQLYTTYLSRRLAMSFWHWLTTMPARMTWATLTQTDTWSLIYTSIYTCVIMLWVGLQSTNNPAVAIAMDYVAALASMGNFLVFGESMGGEELDMMCRSHEARYRMMLGDHDDIEQSSALRNEDSSDMEAIPVPAHAQDALSEGVVDDDVCLIAVT